MEDDEEENHKRLSRLTPDLARFILRHLGEAVICIGPLVFLLSITLAVTRPSLLDPLYSTGPDPLYFAQSLSLCLLFLLSAKILFGQKAFRYLGLRVFLPTTVLDVLLAFAQSHLSLVSESALMILRAILTVFMYAAYWKIAPRLATTPASRSLEIRVSESMNERTAANPISHISRLDLEHIHYTLSTDGTPLLLFQGFVLFIIIYDIYALVLLPVFLESSWMQALILRCVLFPMLFAASTSVQHFNLFRRSHQLNQYRTLQIYTFQSINGLLGRLMIVQSGELEIAAVFIFCLAIIEILMRITYPFRSYIFRIIWRSIKGFYQTLRHGKRRVIPMHDISQVNIETMEQSIVLSPRGPLGKWALSETTVHIRTLHLSYDIGIQYRFIILAPIMLFLLKDHQDSFQFTTIDSIDRVLLSIAMQLISKILVDLICLHYEVRIMGLPVIERCFARPQFFKIFDIVSLSSVAFLALKVYQPR